MAERAWRALAALALLVPAAAGAVEAASRYGDCAALVTTDAGAALESARRWLDESPASAAARHCLALALIATGNAAGGAAQLTSLAAGGGLPQAVRGELFAQAGNGWLIADHPELALAAFDNALALRPGDVELLIDRARAHAGTGEYWAAVADLDAALDIAPGRDDALAFRAAAYRRLEVWELAADDASRALAANAGNTDALIERAVVRLHQGDDAGARADFTRILLLAPGGAAADLARGFLAELKR